MYYATLRNTQEEREYCVLIRIIWYYVLPVLSLLIGIWMRYCVLYVLYYIKY